MIDLSPWRELEEMSKQEIQLKERLEAFTRRFAKEVRPNMDREEAHKLVFSYYRKYYQWTLSKENQALGLHQTPLRDMILDFPWKDCELDRFFCLKVWEKVCR